jgi:hypothetical protein
MRRPALFPILVCLFLIAGCSLEPPGTPRWQVEVTIPIADRVYPFAEIVGNPEENDSLGNWISTDQGLLIFNLADSIDPQSAEDQLCYDAFDRTVRTYVGVRTVDSPGVRYTQYSVAEVAPQLPVEQTLLIPPFIFELPYHDLSPYDEYEWAYLDWGNALVTITNNLPTPVYDIVIKVFDPSSGLLLLIHEVPDTLQPGGSVNFTSGLPVGEEITNSFRVQISGASPGSSEPVLVSAGANIRFGLTLSPLGVTAAHAHLSEQEFDEDTAYVIEESNIVYQATIRAGYFYYDVENHSELINQVTLTLPDFTRDGQPLQQEFTLQPHQTLSVDPVNLQGYQLNCPDKDNRIRVLVSSNILDTAHPLYQSADSMITFDQYHYIQTEIHVSDLLFSEFAGNLSAVEIAIEQDPQILTDIPQGLEAVTVETADMDLRLWNSTNMPMDVCLRFEAYKNGVPAAVRELPPLSVPPATELNPGELDTTIGGMEDLVNVIPDSILTLGKAIINGEGSITEDQFVSGYYAIYSPFAFALEETKLEPQLSVLSGGYGDPLAQVDLTLDLESHVPLSGEAMLLASYDSTQFGAGGAADTLLRASLPQAQVSGDGFVAAPGYSTETRTLDESDLALFSEATPERPLYIQTQIILYSTGGEIVRLRTSDHVTVGAAAHLVLDVNHDDNH